MDFYGLPLIEQKALDEWGTEDLGRGVSVAEGCGEEEVPGGIEVEPPLRSEPTRRHSRHMQQGMAVHAHQFRPVPGEEGSGCLANLGGMLDQPETDRAPLPLIAQNPAQAKQAKAKGGDQLDVGGCIGVRSGER